MLKVNLNKYFYTIVLVGIAFLSFGSSGFEEGNQLYKEGKYSEAIVVYQNLIDSGNKSENLYYNTANTYFRLNEIGKSILYFEKTLKINPENDNAYHNLRLLNTKIEDSLEFLPEMFFVIWWKKLINYFSMNTWAWIAISFSWFSVIAFAFFLFSKNTTFKKASFSKAFFFGFIAVVSMIIAGISSGKIFKTEEIILVVNSSYGKDAPSENGANQELFHEGTKLEVIDNVNDFYKVNSSEGKTYWVRKKDFLLID